MQKNIYQEKYNRQETSVTGFRKVISGRFSPVIRMRICWIEAHIIVARSEAEKTRLINSVKQENAGPKSTDMACMVNW